MKARTPGGGTRTGPQPADAPDSGTEQTGTRDAPRAGKTGQRRQDASTGTPAEAQIKTERRAARLVDGTPSDRVETPTAPADRPRGRHRVVQLSGLSPLWARVGLRARVTLLFGLGALVLSAVMGGLSYFTARHFLVGDRNSASLRQSYVNAELIRNALLGGRSPSNAVNTVSSTQSVLYSDQQNKWFPSSISIGQSELPADLRTAVLGGHVATQTFDLRGASQIAVGVPLPSVKSAYFEVFDLSDLDDTLRILALTLFAAGAVTTLLGAAVGRSASSRTLRPLANVSRAAVAIAGGKLDTRLEASPDDPDLSGLTSSFNLMVEQLQERIERDSRFASDVSHELRSPLTTLAASLEVLEAKMDELPAPAQRAVVLLGADLRRFQRMVGDLLEISRSDTGSAEVSPDEVDATELVRQSVGAARRALGPDSPAPEVDVAAGLTGMRIVADKRRFERVVVNLLENAAVHGGGATRVTAEPGPGRGGTHTLRVAVEDRGPGLAPTERARVFERFYRGSAAGRRGTGTGSGLGLALVAEHVRLHGGEVWAEEAPGGGARFVVELPAADQSEAGTGGDE